MKVNVFKTPFQAFELFIVNYPDTIDLIRQMQLLMKRYDWYGREEILQKLCESIKARLLHVGRVSLIFDLMEIISRDQYDRHSQSLRPFG
jgi:hypothetical protein